MTNFQKVILVLLVIITGSIVYYFVIIPNQNKSNIENIKNTNGISLDANPQGIINGISESTKEKGTINKETVYMPRFYEGINKWISSKNGYQIEFKIYSSKIPLTVNDLLEYSPYKNVINNIREYIIDKGFTKNIYNTINDSNYDKWDSYFEGYEKGNTKCSIESIIGSLSVDHNQKNYIPLVVTCANDFDTQKTLQMDLLDSVGKYLLISMNGLYVNKEGEDFYHAVSVSHGIGGIEMIFKKSQSRGFDVIYAGNSGIPCSIVQQYNIPFYIAGECN